MLLHPWRDIVSRIQSIGSKVWWETIFEQLFDAWSVIILENCTIRFACVQRRRNSYYYFFFFSILSVSEPQSFSRPKRPWSGPPPPGRVAGKHVWAIHCKASRRSKLLSYARSSYMVARNIIMLYNIVPSRRDREKKKTHNRPRAVYRLCTWTVRLSAIRPYLGAAARPAVFGRLYRPRTYKLDAFGLYW